VGDFSLSSFWKAPCRTTLSVQAFSCVGLSRMLDQHWSNRQAAYLPTIELKAVGISFRYPPCQQLCGLQPLSTSVAYLS
jgi:hypothetical protein